MKKIKILLLVVILGGAAWALSGGISASSEKVVPKALWNAISKEDADDKTDSDKDGLSDQEEEKLGTDPQKADSDGDKFLDGQEVHDGYDPLRAAPGDRVLNNNTNSNTNTNSSVGSGLNPEPENSRTEGSSQRLEPTGRNNDKKTNVTEQVASKVDEMIARYNLYTTPYDKLDEATKAELEKELNSFSTDIIKNTSLDFAFNIPDETLRVNDTEANDKEQYIGRAKDILRKHNLIQENQTIEEGIKSILSELSAMSKNDINWDKVNNWKKEAPLTYQELLEMPVNSGLKSNHIRLLRIVKSLDIVFGNINEGDYFRAFLSAGRAEKIGGELDKFTEELK